MDYAFEFIIKNGGIDTESDLQYPYKSTDGRCDEGRVRSPNSCTSIHNVCVGDK